MSGGGSSSTTASPWGGAEPYLTKLLQDASELYGQGADYTKEYVGLTDPQRDALEQMRGFYGEGGQFGNYYSQMQNAVNQMMAAPESVYTDPTVQGMITSGQDLLNQQLTEEFLPTIRSGATSAGQYGSTRQGVAEGVAQGKTAEAGQRMASDIYGRAYNEALRQRQLGTSLMPMLEKMGTAGQTMTMNIEDILRQDQQGALDQAYWNRLQAPWAGMEKYAQLLYPAAGFGGQQTTTGGGPSTLQGAAGGAMAGASVGGPWGALAGGVLGGLSAA